MKKNLKKASFIPALMPILVVLLVSTSMTFSLTELQLPRSVDVREGAGSYFPLVLRADEGATVTTMDEEDGWVQVQVGGEQGWVPKNTIADAESAETDESESEDGDDVRDRMNRAFQDFDGSDAEDEEDNYATPAEVTAAVRGFSRQYQARMGDEVEVDLTDNFERRLDRDSYRRFRRARAGLLERRRLRNAVEIDINEVPPPNTEIDQVSWAAANRLASEYGLVEDYDLQKYLNYVGHWVVENSHRYDVPVQVHILDEDKVMGYAIPAGIIMISRGALELMENEAELAHMIAHEVAHISFQHGDQELHQRQPRIRAERAFSELEDALGYDERQDEDHVQLVQELSDWADQVYEYVISDRLEEYEFEADHYGLIYMARAGYEPSAAVDFLERVLREEGDLERERGSLEWSGAKIENRISEMNASIRSIQVDDGNLNRSEFREMVSF